MAVVRLERLARRTAFTVAGDRVWAISPPLSCCHAGRRSMAIFSSYVAVTSKLWRRYSDAAGTLSAPTVRTTRAVQASAMLHTSTSRWSPS